MTIDSVDIGTSTTAIITEAAPDSKTRRYDRQLRLWAASGQNALESAHILVVSASATSTSVLKNLVLPGIGKFTILDSLKVTPEDAGNNFFLEGPSSIGKSRAEEAVRLLGELNEGVEGKADVRTLEDLLSKDKEWFGKFTIVITHNLDEGSLQKLSQLLWEDHTYPPLLVIRSAGFLAEFYLQFHEHDIVESHPDTTPSLRIDKPFPALVDYSMSIDFENMDVTDHGHIPYVVILVRVLEDWKKAHNGSPPSTSAEKQEFKKIIRDMRKKPDEENFEEAEAQAYRCWTPTVVPSEVTEVFNDQSVVKRQPSSPPFCHLAAALHSYTQNQPPYTLPLSSTLPDMKSNTSYYIELQKLYKKRAEEEKEILKSYIQVPGIKDDFVDLFVKNSHGIRVLRGKQWGKLDADPQALAVAIETSPKQLAIHLALSAYALLSKKQQPNAPVALTVESLTAEAQNLLPFGSTLPEDFEYAVGEVVRAPNADLPNTAAFLGGLVAQETIKMITHQYIPINGFCVIDLVDSWTGLL